MGLRTFHLFFILVAVIASVGFGLWCFLTEDGRELAGSSIWGGVSIVVGVGLVIYGVKFMKKLDEEGIE